MMSYEVYYQSRWLKKIMFGGVFSTLSLAYKQVDYLESKLPNGRKITFNIVGKPSSIKAH